MLCFIYTRVICYDFLALQFSRNIFLQLFSKFGPTWGGGGVSKNFQSVLRNLQITSDDPLLFLCHTNMMFYLHLYTNPHKSGYPLPLPPPPICVSSLIMFLNFQYLLCSIILSSTARQFWKAASSLGSSLWIPPSCRDSHKPR